MIAPTVMSAKESAAILALPVPTDAQLTLPFSDELFACKPPVNACVQQHEAGLIKDTNGSVVRESKQLRIVTTSGTHVDFRDWSQTGSPNSDGDGEVHWYLGTLAGNAYHRVEVQFEQDSPGSFLVNPRNGKTAFVHNGDDVVAMAPDGAQLVTFNALNPPFNLRVAALDATGPTVQLQCSASQDSPQMDILFKGWQGPRRFALVLKSKDAEAATSLAMQASLADSGWSYAVSEVALLEHIGMGCRIR
jgi:hypothetical protein